MHACMHVAAGSAWARFEAVNRPELLPEQYTTVIDVAGWLGPNEVSEDVHIVKTHV